MSLHLHPLRRRHGQPNSFILSRWIHALRVNLRNMVFGGVDGPWSASPPRPSRRLSQERADERISIHRMVPWDGQPRCGPFSTVRKPRWCPLHRSELHPSASGGFPPTAGTIQACRGPISVPIGFRPAVTGRSSPPDAGAIVGASVGPSAGVAEYRGDDARVLPKVEKTGDPVCHQLSPSNHRCSGNIRGFLLHGSGVKRSVRKEWLR